MNVKIITILLVFAVLNIQLFANDDNISEESQKDQKPCLVCVADIEGDSWWEDNLLCNTKCRKMCMEGRATFTFEIDLTDSEEDDDFLYD